MVPALKIGLTGGIASGKTTAAKLFALLGVPIIDADEIAHQLTQAEQPALKEIVQAFGADILDNNGELNRAKLRYQVFNNVNKRKRLEAILHPRIREMMQLQAAQVKFSLCLLVIPLLLETKQLNAVEHIIVVDCPAEIQYKRLITRGLATQQIQNILNIQASRIERLSIANDIIYNNTTLENIKQQVHILYQIYYNKANSNKSKTLNSKHNS
ncbi:MAG: dephospho-CoA kinase [Thiomargarita sp.]|nr:dephospho-CoA kinase [Thiomargarita sp.]